MQQNDTVNNSYSYNRRFCTKISLTSFDQFSYFLMQISLFYMKERYVYLIIPLQPWPSGGKEHSGRSSCRSPSVRFAIGRLFNSASGSKLIFY